MRILLIAEQADPGGASVPLVGWSHATAIARLPDVDAHLVTQVRHDAAFRAAGLAPGVDYTAIDSEAVARPVWRLEQVLRGGPGRGWTTAMALKQLPYRYFEHLVWRAFGERIRARGFDVVHRITPLSPTLPSPIAVRCARAGVPFVLGPLNGGIPWPRGFDRVRREEREWLSYLRGLHTLAPGYRPTRRHASAILTGSVATLEGMPGWARERCVYLPENAIDPARFPFREREAREPGPLRLVFVGRFVPYKGPDMAIEAAAPLLARGAARLSMIGDGPMRADLEALADRLGVRQAIEFTGWIPHQELAPRLAANDALVFPSIREFGGGVALEAMALGVVPLVVAYGGPGELVSAESGFAIPMMERSALVAALGGVLEGLAADPDRLLPMARRAQERVYSLFTWDARAAQARAVYEWVTGRRADRPDFGCPLREPARSCAEQPGPATACASVQQGADER